MPPANTSTSPTDVDNEATAELPVLDVAAYESSLNEHTDSWAVPKGAETPVTANAVEATMVMPVLKGEASPTLQASTPAYDLDHSGTHEMPAMLPNTKPAKPTAVPTPVFAAAAAERAAHVYSPVTLPPSPPLIEELRNGLARAERRIEELNERARIADAERNVAVARANAETAQLREQLAVHMESLQTAKERLGVQSADQPQLEDQLFARADRIVALEKDLAVQAAVLAGRIAQLAKSEQLCERLDCDATNLRTTVTRRNAQIATLEADLLARQKREALLNVRLSDALASTDPYVPKLRGELHELDEQIRLLKVDLELTRTLAAEKDHDLQVAEESIRNLEIEVRDKTGKLEEANVTVEEWRAVIAESQRSILQRDARIPRTHSYRRQHRLRARARPPHAHRPRRRQRTGARYQAHQPLSRRAAGGPGAHLDRRSEQHQWCLRERQTRRAPGSERRRPRDHRAHAVPLHRPRLAIAAAPRRNNARIPS